MSIVPGSAENEGRFNVARREFFLRAAGKTNEKVASAGKLCIGGKRGASAMSLCESGRGCITRR